MASLFIILVPLSVIMAGLVVLWHRPSPRHSFAISLLIEVASAVGDAEQVCVHPISIEQKRRMASGE